MISDLLLRWVVTALFLVSAAECLYAVATGRRVWTHVVGQLLHFAMAVAMAVMAWPAGAALPTTGPAVFFLLAAVWFAVRVLADAGHRIANAYHGWMILAMAWMYAAMSGAMTAQPPEGAGVAGAPAAHHGTSQAMPGMDMGGQAEAGGTPPFVVGLNWLCAISFAVATLVWLYVVVARRRAEPHAPLSRSLGTACQAMMAAGMAIMFAVML